jgi:hypothetical protein
MKLDSNIVTALQKCGGWKAENLALLGIRYPLPKGWIKTACSKPISGEAETMVKTLLGDWLRLYLMTAEERKREQQDNSVRYFIKCEGQPFVKIGFAKSLENRLKGLQTASPFNLHVLATTRDFTEDELHNRFAQYHHRGEWFRYEGALQVFIESLPNYKPETRKKFGWNKYKRIQLQERSENYVKEWIRRKSGFVGNPPSVTDSKNTKTALDYFYEMKNAA